IDAAVELYPAPKGTEPHRGTAVDPVREDDLPGLQPRGVEHRTVTDHPHAERLHLSAQGQPRLPVEALDAVLSLRVVDHDLVSGQGLALLHSGLWPVRVSRSWRLLLRRGGQAGTILRLGSLGAWLGGFVALGAVRLGLRFLDAFGLGPFLVRRAGGARG